jgi:hypothetical protein
MKNNTKSLASIALLALSLSVTVTANAAIQVYDLNTDWSETQNPNGAWSYRQGDTLLINNPSPWVARDYASSYLFGATVLEKIAGGPRAYGPWMYGYFGENQNLQEGDVVFVPGAGGNILWTAPADGTIDISGIIWWAYDYICSADSVASSWKLSRNGTLLSGGDVEYPPCDGNSRDNPFHFSTGSDGAAALQNISVKAGDQIVLTSSKYEPPFYGGEPLGVNLTITLTTASADPVAAIEDLAITVFDMNLQNGIENSLDSKLDAALDALVDANFNNDGAACNSLAAFISAVEAQRGKKITSAQADQLISTAQQIKTMLNCQN